MSTTVHFFVRFEPKPGKASEFRDELMRVTEPTRAEAGCVAQHIYESLSQPVTFAIYSKWIDEAAFEVHAQLPHTIRFLKAAEALTGHPVQGIRTREIAGGPGAAGAPSRPASST
jgi:quinol monooxygenase YgiN